VTAVRVWIDIENPPQVKYLLPFRAAFEAAGADVVVTARDYGFTYALLEEEGAEFTPVGEHYGKSKLRKVAGVLGRTRALAAALQAGERPSAMVSAGRASALAARRMGIPSFVLTDYEHVHLALFRVTGSFIVFPEVIGAAAFTRRGLREDRLIGYRGIKEDLTFANVDVAGMPAQRFPGLDATGATKVLFRPPAVESHYYREASGSLSSRVLEHLAAQDDVALVFSPRYPWQAEELRRFEWRNEPVVLERAVPFVSLLKGVDAVVSAGGTMLREAAYLGVPAFSIFQGEIGGVDRHLAELGSLRLVSDPSELRFERRGREPLAESNPQLLAELVETILERLPAPAPRRRPAFA
jgi:predicted glycosyltransferase